MVVILQRHQLSWLWFPFLARFPFQRLWSNKLKKKQKRRVSVDPFWTKPIFGSCPHYCRRWRHFVHWISVLCFHFHRLGSNSLKNQKRPATSFVILKRGRFTMCSVSQSALRRGRFTAFWCHNWLESCSRLACTKLKRRQQRHGAHARQQWAAGASNDALWLFMTLWRDFGRWIYWGYANWP